MSGRREAPAGLQGDSASCAAGTAGLSFFDADPNLAFALRRLARLAQRLAHLMMATLLLAESNDFARATGSYRKLLVAAAHMRRWHWAGSSLALRAEALKGEAWHDACLGGWLEPLLDWQHVPASAALALLPSHNGAGAGADVAQV